MLQATRRSLGRALLAALVGAASLLPCPARAEAADAWAVAAEALGVLAAYKSSLTAILSLGNNAAAQMSSRRQDLAKNGVDPNPLDRELVDGIMQQLVGQGSYALKANSLPFIWAVNDDAMLNAACYPTNYITVNRGIVRGLHCDTDELAAVLAHEMTHGIEQHSAHNYAQAVAQYMAMSLINMHTNSTDWNSLNALVNYSIATNITLPTETEADEGGFYLMASAGFNPGGAAAAMARMQHYLRYETENIYEFDTQEKRRRDEYSDHPETESREQALLALLTAYGCGHVTVQGRKDIFIDGVRFLSAAATDEDYDNTMENAYYIAGGLAKAFHDHDTAAAWNFRTDGGGRDFLDGSRAYAVLKDFVRRQGAGEKLERMVASAYELEAANGARDKLWAAETVRRQKLDAQREEALAAKESLVKQLRANADAYSDYGEGELALRQVERAFRSRNQDNLAECYAVRGRAKAVQGDFAGALADEERAIGMDAQNLYNYLNRADVYHMMGDLDRALADCERAKEIDAKNTAVWYLLGGIYDDRNERENALMAYRTLYGLNKSANVPQDYLKDIDPKEAKRRQKILDEQKAASAPESKK